MLRMKRIIAIDYGKKRVGVALSDESRAFALPQKVLPNDASLLGALKEIIQTNDVDTVVVGESKNYSGEDNLIMKDIRQFKKNIEKETGLAAVFEPEFLTSAEASHIQGKTGMLDASAAALILQSYIRRQENG